MCLLVDSSVELEHTFFLLMWLYKKNRLRRLFLLLLLKFRFSGDGKADLVFDNAELAVKYKPKVIERNGKSYIQTDRFQLDFDTSRLHINLENLFNGDKALGDNMNLFLNENWRDILMELKPAITFAVEEILKGLINRIFMKVPYDEIFLNDK